MNSLDYTGQTTAVYSKGSPTPNLCSSYQLHPPKPQMPAFKISSTFIERFSTPVNSPILCLKHYSGTTVESYAPKPQFYAETLYCTVHVVLVGASKQSRLQFKGGYTKQSTIRGRLHSEAIQYFTQNQQFKYHPTQLAPLELVVSQNVSPCLDSKLSSYRKHPH